MHKPPSIRQRVRSAGRRHSYSFFSSLGSLTEHRVSTLMTLLVLGIAMLLPLGFHTTLLNLDRIDLDEEEWGVVTVFMHETATEQQVTSLAQELRSMVAVAEVQTISPAQGMAEFREVSGFGESLDLLEENPLPWVVSITPAKEGENDASVEETVAALSASLSARAEVASVSYDQKWLERLGRLVELGKALVTLLALLFGLAVIVVVANTIRLDVAARTDEIETMAMVGAFPGFIRQPFLYAGFWYGLLGSVVAVVFLNLGLEYLQGPLERFLHSYGQETLLLGPGVRATLVLLLMGGVLGWFGAFIAVQRHLRQLRVGGTLGKR